MNEAVKFSSALGRLDRELINCPHKTLDAVTGGRGINREIDGRPIKFPARWSRYYANVYDPATFDFLSKHIRAGDTVLDIGAHIGLFSVAMAKAVGNKGRVFSFEPTPFTRRVLEDVVRLNGCSETVEVRAEAVSSAEGKAVFYDTGEDVSNANSLVKTDLGKTEIEVPLTSIDAFVSKRALHVTCIKIDVEGAEFDLLNGARQTFETQRPAARLGLHPSFIIQNGHTLDEIWQLLSDYNLNVIFESKPVERDWFCSRTDLFDVNLLPS